MANVILLMSDEHNPYYSSVYGHPFVKTPNMERLAAGGTLYKNAYCPSPLCTPSRSSVMSGKRVHEIQMYNNCNVNSPSNLGSYGLRLNEQGVHSVFVGKTHVYAMGSELGFSEMILPKDTKPPGTTHFLRRPFMISENAAERATDFGVKEYAFDGDLQVMEAALRWLHEVAPSLNQSWTLTINLINPHFPQWNTEEFWDLYAEHEDLPPIGKDCLSANHPYAKDLREYFETDKFSEEQVRGLRRGYYGNVSFVDQQLGRLLDVVEQLRLKESTNVIYTSDHGEMLGKFGMWWKCSLYEDSVHIPCIAAGPDFEQGKVVETPIDLLDVQATLFHSVGAKRPSDWQGTALQVIPDHDESRVVFSEYHGHGTRSGAYMIRKGDWKLIYYMEAEHQLFNLRDDPDELDNVYDRFPDKVKELEQELRQICNPELEDQRAHDFQIKQWESVKHYF